MTRLVLVPTLLAVGLICLVANRISGADLSSTWLGSDGNWGDGTRWDTVPNYPNNVNGLTYDATINSGAVTLDRDITIQRFFLNGGTLSGSFDLTLNEGLSWTEGTISGFPGSALNLAAGSTSTIAAPDTGSTGILKLSGRTINNAGTVTQSTDVHGSDGAINNLPGATWNVQPSQQQIAGGGLVLWRPFNNSGNFLVGGTATSILSLDDFNNSGSVTLQAATPGPSNLYLEDGGSGSGSFNLAAQSALIFGGVSSSGTTYTLTEGATINGDGVAHIAYSATLNVAGNTTIGTSLENSGTLAVQLGATLTLNGSFTQSIFSNAMTRLNGGTITSAQSLAFQRGTLAGFGTINANVISNATISPGASAGTMTIDGNLSLLSNATIVMEIGGVTQGTEYDYLAISGSVGLDGTLELRMIDGFEVQLDGNQTFTPTYLR